MHSCIKIPLCQDSIWEHLGNFESFIRERWGVLPETQRIDSKLPCQSCFLSFPHLLFFPFCYLSCLVQPHTYPSEEKWVHLSFPLGAEINTTLSTCCLPPQAAQAISARKETHLEWFVSAFKKRLMCFGTGEQNCVTAMVTIPLLLTDKSGLFPNKRVYLVAKMVLKKRQMLPVFFAA